MGEIKVSADDITKLESKLESERDGMPADEAAMFQAILNRAKAEKEVAATNDPNWIFGWNFVH
jgi:hypothetical protein